MQQVLSPSRQRLVTLWRRLTWSRSHLQPRTFNLLFDPDVSAGETGALLIQAVGFRGAFDAPMNGTRVSMEFAYLHSYCHIQSSSARMPALFLAGYILCYWAFPFPHPVRILCVRRVAILSALVPNTLDFFASSLAIPNTSLLSLTSGAIDYRGHTCWLRGAIHVNDDRLMMSMDSR